MYETIEPAIRDIGDQYKINLVVLGIFQNNLNSIFLRKEFCLQKQKIDKLVEIVEFISS